MRSVRFAATTARRKTTVILLTFGSFLFLLLVSTFHYDVRLRFPALRHGKWPDMVGGSLTTPPPTYDRIIAEENALPQHNLSLPFPEGRHGRYVKFTNQIRGLGWNNVLNELLLCTHLAWRAKRAYVFEDYSWKPQYYPWRTPTWPLPRTPLSALIAGPTVGGPWEEGDAAPRSIRENWWYKTCTPEDTDTIHTDVAKPPVRDADAKVVMEHWLKLLNDSPKRCVEVVGQISPEDSYPQTFDLWVISTPRILPIWSEFRDSPTSRLLKTSPLVNSAIQRNEHLFSSQTTESFANPYDNMMAVHLRRGDYREACQGLADWNSTFYQWNLLPELPDGFTPPPGGWWGKNTPENEEIYFKRCFPTEEGLIEKIQRSKLDWENGGDGRSQRVKLETLYIMTNAKRPWLSNFKQRLLEQGWETVVTSADLTLDDEQLSVGMAVDMDIGRRAAVFIGNGWSSLTSNVIHRRLVDGHEPSSIRRW